MFIKSPDFMKSSLPWKVSGSVPAYIWYEQSDFCSLELHWQYLQKSWWSSGIISKKVTWVRFPPRINTVYSQLPPINDLFLKSLNQTYISKIFSCRMSDQKIFQLCCIKPNSSTFLPTLYILLWWFGYSRNNFILGYIWKIVNW